MRQCVLDSIPTNAGQQTSACWTASQCVLDNVPVFRTCKLAKRLQVSHIPVATRALGKMGSPQLGTEKAFPDHQTPQ